ncbi:MAG: hypothetical protein JEZ06_15680 [Anaerolineaceae bacterium]|nr:hypothetical protein [Anaerolineaceae bacterium]
MSFRKRTLFILLIIIMIIIMACNMSLADQGESEAEKTLQAIYVQQSLEPPTQAAQITPEEIVQEPTATVEPTAEEIPDTPQEATATVEIVHTTIPGKPGWVSQWWMDTSSKSTASQNRANGGDNLNQNLLERPFTAQDMLYHPDVDLQRIEISQDSTFYYFLIYLSGLNSDLNILSAHYGVEIDINRDGRGNVLLWVKGDDNKEWNIDNVFVYRDTNTDVGGSHPIQADAPDYSGDSYDELLFSPDHLNDPDAAWKRVDPANTNVIQLALKKSLLNNAATFMWNGWADDGVSDPTMFDYNDFFTLSEAGSPIKNSANYPLKDLYLVDNTCRLAYGFEPTGDEAGVCPISEAGPTPNPETPPCVCIDFPNYTFIDDPECCVQCGFIWYGTAEFACGPPDETPPCTCSDYPNNTYVEDAECCEFCGYNWSGSQEFPCEP